MTAPKNCSGCGKPFTAARKPRLRASQAFISTSPGSEGRTGLVPVVFCGSCRDELKANGGSVWELPAMAESAENLETLVLADQPLGAAVQ